MNFAIIPKIHLATLLFLSCVNIQCSELACYTEKQLQELDHKLPCSTRDYTNYEYGIRVQHSSGTGMGIVGSYYPGSSSHNHTLQEVNFRPMSFDNTLSQKKIIFILENKNGEGIIFEREKNSTSMCLDSNYYPRKIITKKALNLIVKALNNMPGIITGPYLGFQSADGSNEEILLLNPFILIQKEDRFDARKGCFDGRMYVTISVFDRLVERICNLFHIHVSTIFFEKASNSTTKAILREKSKSSYYAKLAVTGLVVALLAEFIGKTFFNPDESLLFN